MDMASGLLGFAIGITVALAFSLFVQINEESMCRRYLDVDRCQTRAVPVTPDGQPLDMSDPFHGEDE